MSTVAVLPVKRFAQAKQRLSPDVDAPTRRELAEAMAGDVIEALSQAGGLDAVIVVSGEPAVLEAAAAPGMEAVRDDRERGQSAAALAGIERALALGATHVLLVPGDCPALEPGEVEALLAGVAPAPSVAVVPDRHGTGTNALLLAPPAVIVPAFGPNSFARHVEAARRAGAAAHVERIPSLGLDVDTAADLAALEQALDELAGRARRTRRVLAQASLRAG